MEIDENSVVLCRKCEAEISRSTNFCTKCGTAQSYVDEVLHEKKWPNLLQVGLFFFLEAICCASSLLIETPSLPILYFFDGIMAFSAIAFFCCDWNENKYILKWPNFSIFKLLIIIVLTMLSSIIVSYLVNHINKSIFEKEISYYSIFSYNKYGAYLLFASMALYPAIFEEIAYRGYVMQKLITIVNEKEAIYISSILFFIIHFSLVSFFWLLPFAFVLGYLRIKTKTIWYGVFLHFFFNLTACFVELVSSGDIQLPF